MLLPALLVAVASSAVYAQAKPKMSDEQALIALDKQWTAAELRLNDEDRKTIDRIVADDFTSTTPFGQIENKTQYMEGLKHTEDTDVGRRVRGALLRRRQTRCHVPSWKRKW
jgi:hypothetical protein